MKTLFVENKYEKELLVNKTGVEMAFMEIAKRLLTNKKQVPPAVFLETKDKVALLMIELPSNSDEKRDLFFRIGQSASKYTEGKEVKRIIFISEAWFTKQDKDKPYIQPSKSPDRKECLVLGSQDSNGKQSHITLPFSREADKISFDKPMTMASIKSPLLDSFWIGYKIANVSH